MASIGKLSHVLSPAWLAQPLCPGTARVERYKGQGTDLRLDGFKHGYVH